jgi:hypothetical protein
MSEINFPSGPWTGFYNYGVGSGRHRMDLSLTFANGNISGDGIDGVGRFVITGRYDGTGGECYWTKSYIGAHDVDYRGFREGKGIWGLWELTLGSGGFHIWPLGQEECEQEAAVIEEPVPAELCAPRGQHCGEQSDMEPHAVPDSITAHTAAVVIAPTNAKAIDCADGVECI